MLEVCSVDLLLSGEAGLQPGRLHRNSLLVPTHQILKLLVHTDHCFTVRAAKTRCRTLINSLSGLQKYSHRFYFPHTTPNVSIFSWDFIDWHKGMNKWRRKLLRFFLDAYISEKGGIQLFRAPWIDTFSNHLDWKRYYRYISIFRNVFWCWKEYI